MTQSLDLEQSMAAWQVFPPLQRTLHRSAPQMIGWEQVSSWLQETTHSRPGGQTQGLVAPVHE
jgi:hypothetical protein